MISIFFAGIFDAEVVDDKEEGDVTRRMITEGRCAGDRRISKLGEVYFQLVIGDAVRLFETWHAFADLCIDPAVGADEAVQVVLFDDIVQEEIQGEFHVLVSCHGGAVVEVFDVERHKSGIRGIYGAVEKTLRGGESGAVGSGGSRVVDYVAANCDTDTVEFGLVRADGGDLAVDGDTGCGHVEDIVGAAQHGSADALGEADNIVGQDGETDRLVGALEKLVQIQGLAGDLIYYCISLFLGYEEMESIDKAGFDSGVAT